MVQMGLNCNFRTVETFRRYLIVLLFLELEQDCSNKTVGCRDLPKDQFMFIQFFLKISNRNGTSSSRLRTG